MGLKKSAGNMYPWVTHTWSVLNGACPHQCKYCYVQAMGRRFPNMRAKYSGPLRLDTEALQADFGKGKIIFIEHLNDLWAEDVPKEWIRRVLNRCKAFPDNQYVFQTKNPARYQEFTDHLFPDTILGTTIESNRIHGESSAPTPKSRMGAMLMLPRVFKIFVTMEPILVFDLEVILKWMQKLRPDFVNIGADSKGGKLPEPPRENLLALIEGLKTAGIEIRQKRNLERLLC